MLTRKSRLVLKTHGLVRREMFSSYYPSLQTPKKPGQTFREADTEKHHKTQNRDKTSESSSIVKSMTENDSYKNFFRDFSNSVMTRTKMTSFQEQQSFDRIFKYLINTKGDIGVTDALKDFAGLSEIADLNVGKTQDASKSGKVISTSEEIKNLFISKFNKNKEVLQALAPTLQYINNEITTSEELVEFVHNKLIEPFLIETKNIGNSNKLSSSSSSSSTESLIKSIADDCLQDPTNPKINLQTFPVLLKFCLNSLTYDFDSVDETLSIIQLIKDHKSIELFEFGLNIDVYNSLISQVWDKTQNLQLIGKLIEDLNSNAIQPDILTYKVLSKIYLKCMSVKEEIKAEPYLFWGDSVNIYKTKNFVSTIKVPKSI